MKNKNNELMVVKANELIQNYKYTLTKTELRVVNTIISNINSPKYDEEFNIMEFDIKDFCRSLGFAESEAGGKEYRILKQVLKNLSNKSSDYINFGDYETIVRWIERPIFEPASGRVKLKLDDYLKPFLLQVSGAMQANLKVYFDMSSKYSMRLYELLKSWDGLKQKEFDVDELRVSIDALKKTYAGFGKFKQTVLDPAVREINEYTDLKVSYRTKSYGRKITAVVFDISHQPMPKSRREIDEPLAVLNASKYSEYRGVLTRPDVLTDAQLVEVVELIRMSEWYRRSQPVEDVELRTYLAAQDRYTVAREPQNYYGYLRDAVLGNYAGLAACCKSDTESSFDTDEFFAAALRRSYGDKIPE